MKNNLILTMKAEKELSAIGGEQTLFKQPTYHPLITHFRKSFRRSPEIRRYGGFDAVYRSGTNVGLYFVFLYGASS